MKPGESRGAHRRSCEERAVLKTELAERLLARIMGWSDAEKASERARLEAFAEYKYDEYQQFAPGHRFLESLALWLRQFDPGERKVAYEFVTKRLIFVSANEMNHLVELAFPTLIRPVLIRDTADELGVHPWRVSYITGTAQYRARRRRMLVLGLSDGARTDKFRRANPDISNEQVFHAYDISDPKAENMLGKLKKELSGILGQQPEPAEATFQTVVLLDDFAGSGTTAIRHDADLGWDGKIPKIIRQLESEEGLGATVASSGARVIVVLYVASVQAVEYIKPRIDQLDFRKGTVDFHVVTQLSQSTRLDDEGDRGLLGLASQKRYFDSAADDEHSTVGKTSKQLGYADGRLPLILHHNTPNNSVYLLWAEEGHSVRGLFPRVSRHRKGQT